MDLTPRLLTEVEFREQWRGYSQSEVDDFLERVAVAVGELQDRLRDALERANDAERVLLERSKEDDEIRRTLVLAQRTADAAVEQARVEAERLVAEGEARRAALDTAVAERAQSELGTLAEERAALEQDIASLRAFVDEHRSRLKAVLEEQLGELSSSGGRLHLPEAPAVAEITMAPAPAPAPEPAPVAVPEPVVEPGDELEPGPEDETDADRGAGDLHRARNELVEALRRAGVEAEEPPPGGDDDAGETTGWFDTLADEEDDDAPLARPEDDDDPFLAELRRAVTDPEPLGPRDHEPPPPDPSGDDDASSGRFRLRRGR